MGKKTAVAELLLTSLLTVKVLVVNFFHIFEIIIFCFAVAIYGLVPMRRLYFSFLKEIGLQRISLISEESGWRD